jgi:hypothetical protein
MIVKQNRLILSLLAVLLLLVTWLPPVGVCAAETLDPTRDCELIIEFLHQDQPIPGAPYCLYQIAAWSADGELSMRDDFSAYPVDFTTMTQEKYRALAQTLDSYVKMDQLEPDFAGYANEYGFGELTGLKPGLYLLAGLRYIGEGGMYTFAPSIISVPTRDSSEDPWMYNVRVLPKCSFQPHGGMGVTTKKVLKIWDDFGNEATRPKSIEVILLCNGEPYDTVELSAQNGWSYVWEDLVAGEEWLVVEVVPEDYSVLIMDDGLVTKIINTNNTTPPPSDPEEDLPQTGQTWWPMPLLMVLGVVLIAAGVRINRGSKHEA